MKTSNKIVGGYALILFLGATFCGVRNACDCRDALPRLRTLAHRLDTTDIRVVEVVAAPPRFGFFASEVNVTNFGTENPRRSFRLHTLGVQIAGDTLKVPFDRDARIDSPTVETVIAPDGQRHPSPFVFQYRQQIW